MAWSWFSPRNKNGEPVFGGYVRRAFSAAMGCFLSCFRIKHFDLDTPQDFVGSRKKNDLTLVFDSEDESLRLDEESVHLLQSEEREFKALKDQARFLKACGTIPDTPVEFRKAVKKWDRDVSSEIEEERAATDLWSDNASAEKLIPVKLSNESPTPIKVSYDRDVSAEIEERFATGLWSDNASAEKLIPEKLSNESPTPVKVSDDRDVAAEIEERFATDLWPDNASAEKLIPEKLSNESPTPVKVSDDWVTSAECLDDSPHSCMIDGQKCRGEYTSSTNSSFTQNGNSPIDASDSEFTSSIQSSDAGTVSTDNDEFGSESTGYIQRSDAKNVNTPMYWSDGKSTSSIQSTGAENVSAPSDLRDSENQSVASPASSMAYTPEVQQKNKSVRFECELDESAHSSKGSSTDDASQHSRTPFKYTDSDSLDSENQSASSSASPMACTPKVQLKNKSVRSASELDESAHSSKGSSSDDASQHSRTPFRITASDLLDSEIQSATSPALSMACTPSVQLRNKSVRFECELDESAHSSKSSSSDDASRHSRIPFKFTASATSVSRPSPFPTPLKLTDDMQTPGTVFLSYKRNADAAKTARIRSQYVYSVTGPLGQKELASGMLHFLDPSLTLNGGATLPSTPSTDSHVEINHSSNERGMDFEASLSTWLKPPAKQDGDNKQFVSFSLDNVDCENTPADRLNLVLKADADNMSHFSPTPWDVNGIPNTTHKYQEDARVRWHATPFEERLEKVLSGETFISRKRVNKVQPVELDAIVESDTAPSAMLAHPESGA